MSDNSNREREYRKIKSLQFLYEVNDNGTVLRNVKSKKHIKIKLDMRHSKSGYYVSMVNIKGKTIMVMMHKIVAECWLGDKPEGYEVDHIDRNSHNNHYSNLRYVTHSDKMNNRFTKAHPISIIDKYGHSMMFPTAAKCSKWMADKYNVASEHIRSKLKQRRSHIYDYDIRYLRAETRHAGSTEQGIVHQKDVSRWDNG